VRRAALSAALAALAFFSAGCIKFLSEIKVRPDGSGTMIQTMTMNPTQMKETMEAVARQMGGEATESKPEENKPASKEEPSMFKEKDLRAKARDLGEGVTFVSAEKIETETAAGVRVTYAFKNISLLSVNPRPGAALGQEGAGASAKEALKFRFSRKANGDSLLTIVFPPKEKGAAKKPAPPPPPHQSAEQDAQQLAVMKQIFKGMHIGMSVSIDGRIVKTNAPYVSGSTVTLMDIDFDPLLANPQTLKALNAKMEGAEGDDSRMAAALKELPGIRVTLEPEVAVEFAAK
jgi:hypothetical protein